MIANSCVQLNKAATSHFNSRVVECRLAAQLMASKEGLEWKEVRKLADLQNILKLSLGQCFELVDKHLTKNAYWKGEVSSLLDVAEDELDEISLSPKTYECCIFKYFYGYLVYFYKYIIFCFHNFLCESVSVKC